MTRWFPAVAVAMVACGRSPLMISTNDAALVDAAPDSYVCLDLESEPCNPVAQIGCCPGDKCTWIIDQPSPNGGLDLAHIGCALNGTMPVGAACTGGSGVAGTDNCVGGAACVRGTCEALCDPSETAHACANAALACATYLNLYDTTTGGSDVAAGVCEPACDPLTQREGAFGATTDASPPCSASGGGAAACYGAPIRGGQFTCSPAGSASATDGVTAPLADGMVTINACAPGNISLFDFTISGAQVALCQGFCLPADTYAGSAAQPSGVAPYDCQRAGVAGSAADSCVFSWSIGGDDGGYDPTIDPITSLEPWSGATSGTGLGVCWNYPRYDHFDPADVATGTSRTQPYPSCADVGLDATIAASSCTAGAPCTSPAMVDAIFGAVELGCVSFETAALHPEPTFLRRRALANVRFAIGKPQRAPSPNAR